MFKFASNKLSVVKIWSNSWTLYSSTIARVWYLSLISQMMPVLMVVGIRIAGDSIPLRSNLGLMICSIFSLYISSVILHRIFSLAKDSKYKLSKSFKFIGNNFVKILTVAVGAMTSVMVISLLIEKLGLTSVAGLWGRILSGASVTFMLFSVIFFGISLLLTIAFILFENTGIIDGCKRGTTLLMQNWWHCVLIFFVPVLVMGFFRILTTVIGFRFMSGSFPILVGYTIIVLTATALILPYFEALLLVLFNDLLNYGDKKHA